MRKVHSNIVNVLLGITLLVFGSNIVRAAALVITPSEQTVGLESPATVDIVVADPNGTIIGAFDFFVTFDPDILEFDSVTFGTSLGGPGNSLSGFIEPSADDGLLKLNVAELSFVNDLSSFQDGTTEISLMSITFNTKDVVGTSPLEIIGGIEPDFAFLGDESGNEVVLTNVGSGSISSVPIPSSIWLLGSALIGILRFKRKM